MSRTDPPPTGTIREQAADWLARRQSGGLDAEGRRQLDAWLAADARHRKEFEDLRTLWEAVGGLADHPAVRSETLPPPGRQLPWRPILAAAAALLLAVGLGWRAGWEGPEQLIHVATQAGESKEVRLADGTVLRFDVGSAATIHVRRDSHRVAMERGEAWFDIPHRPERRFEVETPSGRIVDIGTRFGVRLDGDGRTTVAVAEGEVEASSRGNAEPPHRIVAGQGLTMTAAQLGQPTPIDAGALFAWREGRLVFDRTPLAEAVARANRYRREPIVVAEPALGRLQVSGVFRIEDAAGFVWAIEQGLAVRAVRREGRLELVSAPAREKFSPSALAR
ncbi:MAG: FecR domain-containing protein [Sterolibacteriaceae bacterium MAG5]|nr:FecR domain-containing protein [Candidatus Nitricoxidireducens bremensis]